MKTIYLIVLLMTLMSSCKKEEQVEEKSEPPAYVCRYVNDYLQVFQGSNQCWLEIRNVCSGNLKTFFVEVDVYYEYSEVGLFYCATGEEAW